MSRARVVLLRAFAAATALLFLAMAIQAFPLKPPIPAIQFTYSEAAFDAILAEWQPDGIERFRTHFFIDFPFLASYGVFGYLLATCLSEPDRASGWWRHSFPWLLPFAAAMDASENVLHLYLIGAHAAPQMLYPIAGLIATTKWALIAVFVFGVLHAIAHGSHARKHHRAIDEG